MAEAWDGVEWSGLVHAFGSAANMPGHFAAWLGGSARERLDSGDYLRRASFAFGIWPATAAVAGVLADLLDGGGLGEEEADIALVVIDRVAQLCDLGVEADAVRAQCEGRAGEIGAWTAAYAAADDAGREAMRVSGGSEMPGLVHSAARLGCFDLIPRLATSVLSVLEDERIGRLGWVAATLAALGRHPLLTDQRAAYAARVGVVAHGQTDDRELAAALLAFGDLGGCPDAWLDHPHPGVRWSAALAKSLADDAAAKRLREELVRSPGDYFASFGAGVLPPAQFVAAPYGSDYGEMLLERARG